MKKFFLPLLALASLLLVPCSSLAMEGVYQTANGLLVNDASTDKIGFNGTTPIAQPANTRSARQAMQDLGLLAAGGADASDVFDLTADNTLGEGVDMAFGTTTGTKLGTGTTQKLGFWNVTPIVQPANTVDYVTMLVNLGLRASGGTAAATFPGALSGAALTVTSIVGTGDTALTGHMTVTDAKNFVFNTGTGTKFGTGVTQKIGFWNVTPVVQPTAAAQAALTDSTTGAAGSTLAAGAGVYTLTIPVTLPVGGTTAVDQLTTLTLGHKFKILAWSYVEAVATTGTNSSRVYNMEIGTTDVGTVASTVTVTTASAAVGRVIAGTAVSGANTGTSSDTISIEVAATGTTHDAGSGAFVIKVQNMDTADALASIAALQDAIRTGLVNTGIIKGS